jgi:hypothetical protein
MTAQQDALPGLPGPPFVPYKVITVHQPWASDIIVGCQGPVPAGVGDQYRYKDIENRPQFNSWRGRLFIHAGRTIEMPRELLTADVRRQLLARNADWQFEAISRWQWPAGSRGDVTRLPTSAILGYVAMIGCTRKSWNASPWACRGDFHYHLVDPVALPEPITGVTGKLGLWVPNPDKSAAEKALAVRLAAIP